jgi:hypothetical protein
MDFVNRGVFDSAYTSSNPTLTPGPTRTEDSWEAEMLNEMDNYKHMPPVVVPGTTVTASPSPTGVTAPLVLGPTMTTSAMVTQLAQGIPGSHSISAISNLDQLTTRCQASLSLNSATTPTISSTTELHTDSSHPPPLSHGHISLQSSSLQRAALPAPPHAAPVKRTTRARRVKPT